MSRIETIKNVVTSRAGRQLLVLQKHSPRVMFVVGVVGVVGTVVLASRASLKLEETLDAYDEKREELDQLEKLQQVDPDVAKRTRVLVYAKATIDVAKLYAPAFVVGGLSIAALTGSHVVMSRRNAGLTAAYVAVDRAFQQYRQRVVEQLGEEQDRTLRYGMKGHEIVEEGEHGPEVKQVKVLSHREASMYARFFDESNPNYQRNWQYNRPFLKCQEQYANDLLRARGHVLLNDVYDMLGFERTAEGCVVGWVAGNKDDYISFGVFDDMYAGQAFVNGDERSILLDFNVDGVVYDLIGKGR